MACDAAYGDVQPLDAALDRHDAAGRRLEDDRRVGQMAALERRAGARTARLLVDDGLEDDVAPQPDAAILEGHERADAGRDPGLHVAAAATPELAVGDLARPGIVRPERQIADRHDVDVAVEDQ